ncbi:hypothetical protein CBR_g48335 [Chara braunii]|uniref:Uncharacterized protein n=1 Tax=Chara braunii TaxID=69332 RepID=A0A388K4A1_CHABU|nr:hypothetical protein CBR_g48335 [Chara braunii]|eukprot:GBG64867.1 hypothetical protein CBR_g48335 [Chara braunii]
MLGFVVAAQKETDRHRFPSSAMAMGDSLSYTNGHGGSPGVGMRTADDRSLASEDLSPSITLVTQDLFVRDVNGAAGTPRVVLVHTPEALFNSTRSPLNESSGSGYECQTFYRNIVFLPNSTRFFSILEQSCVTKNYTHQQNLETNESVGISDWSFTFREMSVRQADLLPVRQGLKPIADETVLSYWWPENSTDGERVSSPILYQEDRTDPLMSSIPSMATLSCMDIAKNGTHLVLSSSGFKRWLLTSLSTSNGSRSFIMNLTRDVMSVQGLAFDRSKTKLFATLSFLTPADVVKGGGRLWVRLVSADVDESGYPVKSDGGDTLGDPFHTVHRLGSPPDPERDMRGSDVSLSPHSVTSSGRCIYLMNTMSMDVIGVDPSTSKLTPVMGRGIETKPFAISPYRTPSSAFYGTQYTAATDIAATLDGCNLFITGGVDDPDTVSITGKPSTGLVWVKMRSRCGKAQSAEVVARYNSHEATGIGSLALQELEGRLFLYVGSTDGRIFELEISRSQLHVCSDRSRRLRPPPLSLLIPFLHLLTFVMAVLSVVVAL